MALIAASLTTPVLATTVGEELSRVASLFARGPEEPLSFKKLYQAELAQARQAAIEATAPLASPGVRAAQQGGPSPGL
jgi:hypothetical protein